MPTDVVAAARIAVPTPLRQSFDYLPPDNGAVLAPGMRVRVSFGRRRVVGIVLDAVRRSELPAVRLKPIGEILDDAPLIPADLLDLLCWAADYYHHPIGEVMAAALPAPLRRGGAALAKAGHEAPDEALAPAPGPELTDAQMRAANAIRAELGHFASLVLHGVTGSGKTEVYLRAIGDVIAAGGQALVLVPEIGLAPQLVQRIEARLGVRAAILHSSRTGRERADGWLHARNGHARVIVGTRSAVLAPFRDLRLIVVDEEHDASYKQQEGFRYSARDVAVMRAARAGIPVVLGSATPSFETLANIAAGRYGVAELPLRTGGAALPAVTLLDERRLAVNDGLTAPLVDAIRARLARGEQSLIFINRRGFAPVWMCHACGWIAGCERCDAKLTLHRADGLLHCHHCGAQRAPDPVCPACQVSAPRPVGAGTQRIETALKKLFPDARIERVDRDAVARRGALDEKLARAAAGDADILIGTQMLAKGHDLPNITLVGVLNADQGLYSADFRATEQLAAMLHQVAGRAGRADKPGEVLIQTAHPEHALYASLKSHSYAAFAQTAIEERRAASLPPFARLALLRAESVKERGTLDFLEQARATADPIVTPAVRVFEPVTAPMPRRAGRFRAQLLVRATTRRAMHDFLDAWLPRIESLSSARRVRWSLDVDPLDLF
jgi:primosomal protein N' (replication factor Y)